MKFIRKDFWTFGIFYFALLECSFAKEGKNEALFNEVLPLLEEYCYDCHGDGAQKGGFAMDELISLGNFEEHHETWDRVWKNAYNRNMPPANVDQPQDREISKILSWIEKESFQYNPGQIEPGHVVLRRLNRTEYENTIKDLFQVTIDAKNYFPADDTGYGFDTIGEVLTLSPLLMEKYMGMAEIVMEKILGPIDDQGENIRFITDDIKGGRKHGDLRVLPSQGSFTISHQSEMGGEYEAKVWASASRAGDELAKMEVSINGSKIKTFSIDSEYPQKLIYTFKYYAKEKSSNKISLSFINDFFDPKNKNPKLRDRNLYVKKIEISFPKGVAFKFKDSRSHLLGEWETEKIDDDHAVKSLEQWIPRIYRMTLEEKEMYRHKAFYAMMTKNGLSAIEALRQTYKAALVSPRFLFREEKKEEKKSNSNYRQIDEFALAHRMSYFLWSSIPDDSLWELAKKGKLRENFRQEFNRMISDKKIEGFINNFCGQWLQLRDLNLVNPDPEQFPRFTDQVRKSMIQETQEFFKYLLIQNLPIDLILGANFSMINQDLARYYRLRGKYDEKFRKVIFKGKDLKKRGGILTHGSILTITSNPTRTSPVKRGKWVLDNLLAAPPRDPPPEVTELEKPHEESHNKLTLRQQMSRHSKNPACYSCHASMDNLGYAMENFDAVGNWRTEEGGEFVDVSGKLSSGEEFNGIDELQTFLLENKKQSIVRCITQKLFVYGIGRGLTYKDRKAVDQVVASFEKDQVNFADLLFQVFVSQPFQFTK
tara:strand:- start:35 stop:2332 length:2298 start_codon:yes stop_codon:yes gene_type:complete